MFFDGYQWGKLYFIIISFYLMIIVVVKTNSVKNIDPNLMILTKKMRRIQITNIPYFIGLEEQDIRMAITSYMKEFCLNDIQNNNPILEIEINKQINSAILEMSSVEETNRLVKINSNAYIFKYIHYMKFEQFKQNIYL